MLSREVSSNIGSKSTQTVAVAAVETDLLRPKGCFGVRFVVLGPEESRLSNRSVSGKDY